MPLDCSCLGRRQVGVSIQRLSISSDTHSVAYAFLFRRQLLLGQAWPCGSSGRHDNGSLQGRVHWLWPRYWCNLVLCIVLLDRLLLPSILYHGRSV
jgi:hypothetical protein